MNKNIYISLSIITVLFVGIFFLFIYIPQYNPGEYFNTDPDELRPSQPIKTVELKNGDIFDLTVSYVSKKIEGKKLQMLAYNDSIPGPTIKVIQGSEITINLKNTTDIPTSLHSHGVRVMNQFDGVVDQLQPAINPGETFTYKITFPDAGMFWYHPHLYEAFTQSHGLYGNYWVVPQEANYWSPVNEEVPLILNDLLVENGEIDQFNPEFSDHALMGKFGNVMLVNGETDYQRSFQTGDAVRFYITNAANTRVFNLSIPDTKMKLVGGDNGKYERETWQDNMVVSPSERVIIEVLFEKPETFILQNKNPYKTYKLATFTVSGTNIQPSLSEEFNILRENQEVITGVDSFRPYFDKAADKSITFSLDMMGMGNHMMGGMGNDSNEKIEWENTMSMMNAMSTSENTHWKIIDNETQKTNMDIDWKFKIGDKIKIKIFNDPNSMHPMQHPLHFHGQRFLVLSNNSVENTNLVWKDTVLIPSGDTVEILVDMQNPGTWMAHCHIAEHLESGMMIQFTVE